MNIPPLLLLLIGIATVIGGIVLLRLNAFVALITAALLVSLLTPGDPAAKVSRVTDGFGRTAASIGIVIALAAVIGKAMMESGAADRIVAAFLRLLGEERGAAALGATGFVLSIPVFFDTVFFLLVPLARSMHTRTGKQYLKYVTAIAGGAAATHALVPPTPGPLAVAAALNIDLGVMVLGGLAVAAPAAIVGYWYAGWIDRRMPLEPIDSFDFQSSVVRVEPPGLFAAVLPILLPVVLISSNTIATALKNELLMPWTGVLGNPNVALLISSAIALRVYQRQRSANRAQIAELSEVALTSAGMIILITAAGGAFGATLQGAQVGPAIQALFGSGSGYLLLMLGFAVASLIKVAQGSSTVAMITTAGMIGAMLPADARLPFHPLYLATAVCSGALVGSWMNDSGFWIVSRMGGLNELQTLRSWTAVAAVVGITAMLVTVLLAFVLPMRTV